MTVGQARVTKIPRTLQTHRGEAAFAILPATFRDLGALRALEEACFGRDAWGYLELIGMMIPGNTVRLKAVADGRVVGLVVGDPRRRERVAWIATIGVHPDYRRRGLGQALLAACESTLREPQIKLTVRASNAAAIALYSKFGYRRVGVWPRYYAGGEDGIVMEKNRQARA